MVPKTDFIFKFLYQLVPIPRSVSKGFDEKTKIFEASNDRELLIRDDSGEVHEFQSWYIVMEEYRFFQTNRHSRSFAKSFKYNIKCCPFLKRTSAHKNNIIHEKKMSQSK